jgi:hypothetical protein
LPDDNIYINPYSTEWFNNTPGSSIDLRYYNIPQHMINIYLDIIGKFGINNELISHLNNKLSSIGGNFLGAHIRTWRNNNTTTDVRSANDRFSYYDSVGRSKFIYLINECQYENVLICTDNKEEVNKTIIPNIRNKRIIFFDSIPELHEIQNDFIEILLLSKCSHLLATLNSTFSELAWWYGGCKAKLDVI